MEFRYTRGLEIYERGVTGGTGVVNVEVHDISFSHCSSGLWASGTQYDGDHKWALHIDGITIDGYWLTDNDRTRYGLMCSTILYGVTISDVIVEHCATGVSISGGSAVVRDSIIAHNDVGVSVDTTNVTLTGNSIRHNKDWGVRGPDQDSWRVTATDNWWGDESGPLEPTLNPGGLANAVMATDFDPWLSSPPAFDDNNKAPIITTPALKRAYVGRSDYWQQLHADGVCTNFTWSMTPLVPGINLSSNGVLSGLPTTAGDFAVTVTATDAAARSGSQPFLLTILPADVLGLVGWWKFDEGTGLNTADSSGRGNDGILLNMEPATDWVAGKVGTALYFDALETTFSCVNAGNAASLNPPDAITVMAWIKPRSYGIGVCTVVERLYSSSYILYLDIANNNMVFFVNGAECMSDALSIATGVWQHVAAVYDGCQVRFYVNGIAQGVVWNPGSIGWDLADVTIGNDKTLTSPVDGAIDDVRIYNVALSEDQVQYVMLHPEVGMPGVFAVSVNSPNGGVNWTAGTTHSVTWSVSGAPPSPISYFVIDYSLDGGASWVINAAYASASATSVAWPIPLTAVTTQARVRVRAVKATGSSMSAGVSAYDFCITSLAGNPTAVPDASHLAPVSGERVDLWVHAFHRWGSGLRHHLLLLEFWRRHNWNGKQPFACLQQRVRQRRLHCYAHRHRLRR